MGADHQDSGTGPPRGASSQVSSTGPPIRSLHVGLMGQKLGFELEAMGVGEILSSPHLKLYRGFPGFVQLLSHVQLFKTPWTAAHQASLSFTNSRSLLKLMSSESVMPSNHLIFCRPLSSCPQSFAASVSFPMSLFFTPGGQSIGASASASVISMNIQG